MRLGTSRLALLFGVALVVALGVFAAIALETFAVEGNLHALRHSIEIANGQRDSVLALVDEERGVRGYVATGDPQFLDSYRAGVRLLASIPELDATAARQFPLIAGRIADARRAARDLEDYFVRTIDFVGRGHRELALDSLKEGKRKFDVYQQREAAVRDAVRLELDRVEGDADAAIRNALLFGLAGAVALAIAAGFIVLELIAERRVERLAERDALTGLANRRLFQTMVENAIARQKRDGTSFALVYLDVDEFKHINDAYSHLVGDDVLQLIAARLADAIRSGDVAARLGGDEFAVLLSDFPPDQDEVRAANRVALTLAGPYLLPDSAIEVHCSVGTSTCPGDGTDFKTLLLRADERMLERKTQRRLERLSHAERRRRKDRPGSAG